jgi:large subunit ribosomal protein L30
MAEAKTPKAGSAKDKQKSNAENKEKKTAAPPSTLKLETKQQPAKDEAADQGKIAKPSKSETGTVEKSKAEKPIKVEAQTVEKPKKVEKVTKPAQGMVQIKQIGSPIRRDPRQELYLKSLGLGKLNKVRNVVDNASTRGLLNKLQHMVVIVEQ